MKNILKAVVVLVCVGMFFSTIGFIASAQAEPKVVKEGPQFSIHKTMLQNIENFKGKTITVTLTSGEVITGKVVDVNNKFLQLEQLERANFSDALIDVNKIIAIKAQVRKYAND